MPDQNDFQRRRRSKLIGFVIAEASALGLLLLTGAIVMSARVVDSTLLAAINIVLIVTAAAVVAIPILFFALSPVLPRGRR